MYRSRLFVLSLAGALGGLCFGRAEAIPAFARKYEISCSACHAPVPRLNAFGEEFAARGFRMDLAKSSPESQTVDTGDPLLELPRTFPISVRLDGYASWKSSEVAETDFETPWIFKIVSGGPITRSISYYVYFLTEQGETVGLEDAWVQFNKVFGGPVDLLVGQFQVSDPLFKRELRLERSDFDILTSRVGLVSIDLTYDRGVVATWHAPSKVDVLLQVVNGNGIEAARDEQFDKDNYKNVALRLVRPFKRVRVGVLGYWGRERGPDSNGAGPTNRTTYLGPDLVLRFGSKWQLALEYLERRDDDPRFSGDAGTSYRTRGGFAELHFFPRGQDGRCVLTALYNRVTSDFRPMDESEADPKSNNASITASYLLARNVRFALDVGRDIAAERNRASLGLFAAF